MKFKEIAHRHTFSKFNKHIIILVNEALKQEADGDVLSFEEE